MCKTEILVVGKHLNSLSALRLDDSNSGHRTQHRNLKDHDKLIQSNHADGFLEYDWGTWVFFALPHRGIFALECGDMRQGIFGVIVIMVTFRCGIRGARSGGNIIKKRKSVGFCVGAASLACIGAVASPKSVTREK